MGIRGVIFDMDGTLTKPGQIDFFAMRSRVGVPQGKDIIKHINSLADAAERKKAWQIIEEEEGKQLHSLQLMDWANELLEWLHSMRIKTALVTRNSQTGVDKFCEMVPSFRYLDSVWTRDSKFVKPDPRVMHEICAEWKLQEHQTMVVGDSYKDDIVAGIHAGCFTCLVENPANIQYSSGAHFSIADLKQLPPILQSIDEHAKPGPLQQIVL